MTEHFSWKAELWSPGLFSSWILDSDLVGDWKDQNPDIAEIERDVRTLASTMMNYAAALAIGGSDPDAVRETLDRWDDYFDEPDAMPGISRVGRIENGELVPIRRQVHGLAALHCELDRRWTLKLLQEVEEIAVRTIELLANVVSGRGSRTSLSLRRVAACYVRGMNVEFAVMARATLEAALQEKVDAEGLADAVKYEVPGLGSYREAGLSHLLKFAKGRWLDADLLRKAESIKDAGDRAAHEAVPPRAAGVVLEDLRLVLGALE